MSFYKRENGSLLEAPNFVIGPGFELYADQREGKTYPIKGWWWFDTVDEACAALGVQRPQQEVAQP